MFQKTTSRLHFCTISFLQLLSHSQVNFESIGGKEECGSSNQSIKSPFLRLTGDIRMDQPGVVSEGINQMELSQHSLISGLPDDIALFCLARVPWKYHTLLKCTGEVYCYDASLNAWSEASPLSTARCYFACEVLDGKIYSIGGLGSNSSDPHSWDIYDPCTNSWKFHSDSNIVSEIEDSVVMDGKIYIHCGTSAVTSHVYAVVYEPSSGTWRHADADMVAGWRGPAVVVDGTLYVLDQSSGTRLMMWQKESREWISVGRLSSLLTRPPCQLVAIGKKFYVVGKGLSTVMFDVENAGNMEG
ncbi:F-box/kelch-repeat protein SKIP4 [Prunus yedoensis var. nudiflora]|uniref:F-box/kelch-repeat protein SKIP4 n=1 Tax=Prunus yedoensis var. nudiflora TaxID=2094558 RepID=A0A314XZ47_PRUYE|nr:F-box/kelch-repeat protein SKIP4 [Prunus yedoensis var. nudiflora]